MYRYLCKRLLDIVVSALGLLALSPLMLTVALLIRIKLGGPVLFRQTRVGRGERRFTLYKFRTMSDKRDESGRLCPDSERISGLGNFLRSASIDELPEFFNIFKGDMSLVGPRPLVEQYLGSYTPGERRRHDIRPGLTGLAQVSGRNRTTWESRFAYDLDYVEHYSFKMDLRILLLTVRAVFRCENICMRGVDSLMDFDEWRRISPVRPEGGSLTGKSISHTDAPKGRDKG